MDTAHINTFIPELLEKTSRHNKEILNRLTICDILTNFESKNSKDLHRYVVESNNRYKETKSGNQIHSVIGRSIEKINPISERILNDNYYTDFNIDKEKKQLKHKLNTKENKSIEQLMKNIKDSTSTLSKGERKIRNRLNQIIEKKQKTQQPDLFKNTNTHIKYASSSTEAQSKGINNCSEEVKEKNDTLINEFFQEDDKRVNDLINKHKEIITRLKLKVEIKEKKEGKETRISDTDKIVKTLKHLINFNNTSFKLLSYSKPIPIVKVNNHNKIYSDPIDVQKIMKISKENKTTSGKFISLDSPSFKKTFVSQVDCSDTKNLVRDEAINSFSMNQTLKEKEAFIDSMLQIRLPLITEYDTIVKDKRESKRIMRQRYITLNCAKLSNEDQKKEKFKRNLKK